MVTGDLPLRKYQNVPSQQCIHSITKTHFVCLLTFSFQNCFYLRKQNFLWKCFDEWNDPTPSRISFFSLFSSIFIEYLFYVTKHTENINWFESIFGASSNWMIYSYLKIPRDCCHFSHDATLFAPWLLLSCLRLAKYRLWDVTQEWFPKRV